MKLELHGIWPTLFIIFLTLKLCGVIDWPWWAIFMPLLIPIAFYLCIIIVITVVLIIANIYE